MAKFIQAPNISLAWLAATEHLLSFRDGKDVNVVVTIQDCEEEDDRIRSILDDFLKRESTMYSVLTVANTIFPQSLYQSGHGELAASKFYELSEQMYKTAQRLPANNRGMYFYRMIVGNGKGKTINQLERVVQRLKKELQRSNPLSSVYELALSDIDGDLDKPAITDEIQIFLPATDVNMYGFPCLSHISLTLFEGRVHMTALYRNQYFLQRAYGNYLGLSRLLCFICREIDCKPGELVCIASHADGELVGKKRAITSLVERCNNIFRAKLL